MTLDQSKDWLLRREKRPDGCWLLVGNEAARRVTMLPHFRPKEGQPHVRNYDVRFIGHFKGLPVFWSKTLPVNELLLGTDRRFPNPRGPISFDDLYP